MNTDDSFLEGRRLLPYSRNPGELRAFLEGPADRMIPDRALSPKVQKSIVVLTGNVCSHLHVSKGGAKLPMIMRTGKYPPAMRVPELESIAGPITTDRDEQRIACDYVDRHNWLSDVLRFLAQFCRLRQAALRKHGEGGFRDPLAKLAEIDQRAALGKHGEGGFRDPLADPAEASQPYRRLIDLVRKEMKASSSSSAEDVVKKFFRTQQFMNTLLDCCISDELGGYQGVVGNSSVMLKWSGEVMGEIKRLTRYMAAEPAPSVMLSDRHPEVDLNRSLRLFKTSLESRTHLLSHYAEMCRRYREVYVDRVPSSSATAVPRPIVVQGAGDLSMNSWNVAYLAPPDEGSASPGQNDSHVIVSVLEEPLDRREYTCLICWDSEKQGELSELDKPEEAGEVVSVKGNGKRRLSIGRLRFSQYDREDTKVRLIAQQEAIGIKGHIRYALYGQRLAWHGEVVAPRDIILQCSDLRHVLRMPNLNKRLDGIDALGLLSNARQKIEGTSAMSELLLSFFPAENEEGAEGLLNQWQGRKRYFFGRPTTDDVWLGEYAFLSSPHLAQAACERPVDIPLSDLGAPLDWVTACLIHEGHTFCPDRDRVAKRGEFSWDILDPTDPRLVWYPRLNNYPCTLVGIGSLRDSGSEESNSALFLLAWGHSFVGDQHYSIFDCARILCDLGAEAVLLIDEGQDVFQLHFSSPYELLKDSAKNVEKRNYVGNSDRRSRLRGSVSFWVDRRE